MFPVDYEETVADDFRTIFSRDNVLGPVQYLWQWLFNRQSLVKTTPPVQLSPQIIYVTTQMPRTTKKKLTTKLARTTTSKTSKAPTTLLMTTSIVRDEFIPVARTRRPLKYKIEGK